MYRFIVLLMFFWPMLIIAQDSITVRVDSVADVSNFRIPPEIDTAFAAYSVKHDFKFGAKSKHWNRTVTLPMSGRFVEESHYVTNRDSFPSDTLFPTKDTLGMAHHLKRSFEIYRQWDSTASFDTLYRNWWQKVWTPVEHCRFGEGAIGNSQCELLDPETELWLLTMMWAEGERPEPGTKFLLMANGKAVVVVAGYETGPGREQFLGGVTPEVHAWLGTHNDSVIRIGYLEDQQLASGPVKVLSKTEKD